MNTIIKITYERGAKCCYNAIKGTVAMDIKRMNLSFEDYNSDSWVIMPMDHMTDIELDPEEEGE